MGGEGEVEEECCCSHWGNLGKCWKDHISDLGFSWTHNSCCNIKLEPQLGAVFSQLGQEVKSSNSECKGEVSDLKRHR